MIERWGMVFWNWWGWVYWDYYCLYDYGWEDFVLEWLLWCGVGERVFFGFLVGWGEWVVGVSEVVVSFVEFSGICVNEV